MQNKQMSDGFINLVSTAYYIIAWKKSSTHCKHALELNIEKKHSFYCSDKE